MGWKRIPKVDGRGKNEFKRDVDLQKIGIKLKGE